MPLVARRLLRAGGPLSPALVAADDGDSGAGRRRRARSSSAARGPMRRCSRRRSKPASIACFGSAARTRSRRWPMAPATVPRVDKIVGPGNRWVSAAKSLDLGRLRHRLLRRPDGDPDRDGLGSGGVDRRRSARAGRARSRCARGDDHHQPRGSPSASPTEVERQMPAIGPARQSIARHGGIIVCRERRPRRSRSPTTPASEHVVVGNESLARRIVQRRRGLRRRLDGAGRRRLRDRLEPRAADRRRRAVSRRPERRRLRQAGVRAARDQARARVDRRRRSRRWRRAEGLEAHARSIEVRQR